LTPLNQDVSTRPPRRVQRGKNSVAAGRSQAQKLTFNLIF